MISQQEKTQANYSQETSVYLAETYYPEDALIAQAAASYTPEHFLRLFITAQGMQPIGTWQTHTYARYTDQVTQEDHFFLIPMERPGKQRRANIQVHDGQLFIDHIATPVYLQSIPYTTPFWYFHYNPNREHIPYESMTLNLSPACLEKCVLCAGAKTGRVNNGMDDTLNPTSILDTIRLQHPEMAEQLDSVAVVTGCFGDYDEMIKHLINIKAAVQKHANPSIFRVLEHNVTTEQQFAQVVGELGYDVFVTLECFDQEIRNIALNGKVGRKGRDSQQFMELIETYAHYLESHPELNRQFVHVTYLMGLDELSVTESIFKQWSELNKQLKNAKIMPWLSIFTPYNDAMKQITRNEFGLRFLIEATELCKKYFDVELLSHHSGGTNEGFARGLF